MLFTDIFGDRIVRYRQVPGGPEITTFRFPSGVPTDSYQPGGVQGSNGMTLDLEGRLIVCEQGRRRVSRIGPDGYQVTLVDRYHGQRLNSPNDVVVRRSDGSIYFTDPPYGVLAAGEAPELPFSGVYRLDAGGGLTLLVDDFDRPNGLAFSPDEALLYIDDTARGHIRVFEVKPDGALANGRLFSELVGAEPGAPDGLKVDAEGNVYCTGPGGIWVISSEGKQLGRLLTPEVAANFTWGDADAKTLFITATHGLYRVRVGIAGIRPG